MKTFFTIVIPNFRLFDNIENHSTILLSKNVQKLHHKSRPTPGVLCKDHFSILTRMYPSLYLQQFNICSFYPAEGVHSPQKPWILGRSPPLAGI